MKNWIRALMIPAATMSFGLVACGDDDPATDTTPTDTTVAETAAETTAETTVTETTTTTAETTVDETTAETAEEVVATATCTNAADLAVIGHKGADGKADTDPAAKAGYCGTGSCLALVFTDLDKFEACVSDCMLDVDAASPPDDTINTPEKWRFAVSADCTDCYVASVRCTGEHCAGQCAADPSATACIQCRADNACTSSFFTCSGLTPPAN